MTDNDNVLRIGGELNPELEARITKMHDEIAAVMKREQDKGLTGAIAINVLGNVLADTLLCIIEAEASAKQQPLHPMITEVVSSTFETIATMVVLKHLDDVRRGMRRRQ
jgi:hypothetical protein